MFTKQTYKFVLPIALAGCCIGFLCWMYITGSDTSRLFEFSIWAGLGAMSPGLLIAAGASDNSFEFGEHYNATKQAQEKQERLRGAFPIIVATVLAGLLIIAIALATEFFIRPLLQPMA